MSDLSTNLHLPFLAAAQAQKHVTVNESLLRLDALVQSAAVSRTMAVQPGAPADGSLYILPSGKSGAAWGAMAVGALAYWRDGAWAEITPRQGWMMFVQDEAAQVVFDAAAWRLSVCRSHNRLHNAAFAIDQRQLSSYAEIGRAHV